MNIYEKIQAVRVELEDMDIKMTGYNEFARYDYFELDDFIKPLNALMNKYKMTAYPSFTADVATLTAVNCEKPDEHVTVTSPMGTANLKGCHEVQNIGAVETYQRRYLYQALFDITEKDGLNATQGKASSRQSDVSQHQTVNAVSPEKQPQKANATVTEQSVRKLQIERLVTGTKFNVNTANEYAQKKYGKQHIDELTEAQYNELYNALDAAVKKEKEVGNGNS